MFYFMLFWCHRIASFDVLVDKCTNVLSTSEDWEAIVGFCDSINKDPDGPQTALKLLVHKIQSPQEKESLLALTVSLR